ncbi:MAG: type II toxin-antitoxin system mRNA interferase toxin, RelE/StbE family [Candidatus Levybacteria bacterium]|nr:type II toxin-antitoxin system mRNA interferase toxin, RelE/StbE family [Candidatus Levybacteria bacterium]
MKVRYSKRFIKQYKKAGRKIQEKADKVILLFSKNPADYQLRNHLLYGKYQGRRSIDVTGDWRAVYREVKDENNNSYAYFIALGTHSQLYR